MRPDLVALRARFARDVTGWARRSGLDTDRVEAAFAAVPRERFLTPPPWRIFSPGGLIEDETSDPAKLYDDVLVVLDSGKGINNGQPSLHADWMAAVNPGPRDRVVQIGVGAGYYTALLATLVGEAGRVDAFEIEGRLAGLAAHNLAELPQVTVRCVSGVGGSLPDADIAYVSAGAAAPDSSWLRCLRRGGRLIFPWQPDAGHGTTVLAVRRGAGFATSFRAGVAFVGCVGASQRRTRPRLAPPAGGRAETRSLWLASDRDPDETATAIYDEVWFSSAEVSPAVDPPA